MLRLLIIGGLLYVLYRITLPKLEAPKNKPPKEPEIEFTDYEEINE